MPNPYYSVKMEGEEVGSLLNSISVEQSDKKADVARLIFNDSHLVLSDVFHEGLSVEIDLGYDDGHDLIFRGVVTGIRTYHPARGQPIVEVLAMNSLINLSYLPNTKRWWNTTVSQVIREVAVANSFRPGQVDVLQDSLVDEVHPLQQVEETDLSFLYRIAEHFDCKLFVTHQTVGPDSLNLCSTQVLMETPSELELEFNDNLVDFEAHFDAFATAMEQHLVTTDPDSGERVEIQQDLSAGAETSWIPDPERIARLGEGAVFIATLMARSALKRAQIQHYWRQPRRVTGAPARSSSENSRTLGDRARRMGQSARGRARGNQALQPRKMVQVNGQGGRWSGQWYVSTARQDFDIENRLYLTTFTCTR